MNHAVGGILPAVSVFRESCYRHIVLVVSDEKVGDKEIQII